MRKGSTAFEVLKLRLTQLHKHLLPFLPNPPVSKVSYSDSELDSTRAYVVLVHAEIEEFCEELVRSKAKAVKDVFDKTGKVEPSLRRMIIHFVIKREKLWNEVLRPSKDVVALSLQSYETTIHDNNGVKRRNLEKLLFPLGIHDKHLSKLTTWLAQMDSFGSDRGNLAHKSIGAQRPPDPLIQWKTVEQLLDGLSKLDRIIGRLR
jgi:hypothetical protein